MAALLGEKGSILYIEGPAGRDVAKVRTKGMLSTKPLGIDIKTLRGDWTQNSGYRAVKSWLALSTSRQLRIGMVACQNDDMAMGARRNSVYALVMRQAGWLTITGLLLGFVGSIGASLFLRKLLFGVQPWDAVTLGCVAILLGLASMAASFLPARRAASVNPVEALRAE